MIDSLLIMLVAALIVVALAGYATHLLVKVRQQARQANIQRKENQLVQQQSAASARQNIIIMLRVVEQGQVSLTEAAIRIMSFTLALPPTERACPEYLPFDQLAKATAHIPILDRWQVLSRSEQLRFDQERAAHEETCRDDISKVIKPLLQILQAHQ